MSNSSLVAYKRISPNQYGRRNHAIDRITPHCVVGQCSVETLGNIFAPKSRGASCNYGIGSDGRVGMYVEENCASWCSSNKANDERAVTIECASATTSPYAFNSKVYATLVKLCVDICKRNGKTKLLWLGSKGSTENYAPKSNEMVLSIHRWYANKACPGDWLVARLSSLASEVTKQLVATGWRKIGNTWYYYNSNGTKATGWLKDGGKWYYLKSDGAMATGWVQVKGVWYYLTSSGAMATGWIKDKGKWYFLKDSGAMATGWLKDKGKWYYLESSGAMAIGWKKVNGKWYYLTSSGAMATGWLKDNNKWYYLSSSGAMVTGTVTIDGKKYTFNSSGALIE